MLQEDEIADLRRTLEKERAARKQQLSQEKTQNNRTGLMQTLDPTAYKPKVPLETILGQLALSIDRPKTAEPVQASPSHDREQNKEHTKTQKDITSHTRTQHAEHVPSMPNRPERRGNTGEVTSAFILPDITINGGSAPAKIPAASQKVLDSMVQHKGPNCSVCKRQEHGICTHEEENSQPRKETVNIPKPTPVSSRMPETSAHGDEPTTRPSQSPALALAKVLKELDDELAHLKMQLALYQNALNKHDASLGRRQRKKILEKIESLLAEVDTKSDQIYALYDVLEGQKQGGQELTEHEVEMTLNSIGLEGHARRDDDLTERLGNDGVIEEDEEGPESQNSSESDDDLP